MSAPTAMRVASVAALEGRPAREGRALLACFSRRRSGVGGGGMSAATVALLLACGGAAASGDGGGGDGRGTAVAAAAAADTAAGVVADVLATEGASDACDEQGSCGRLPPPAVQLLQTGQGHRPLPPSQKGSPQVLPMRAAPRPPKPESNEDSLAFARYMVQELQRKPRAQSKEAQLFYGALGDEGAQEQVIGDGARGGPAAVLAETRTTGRPTAAAGSTAAPAGPGAARPGPLAPATPAPSLQAGGGSATSAADLAGVSANGPDDLRVFLLAMAVNSALVLTYILIRGYTASRIPWLYNEHVGTRRTDLPEAPPPGYFAWARASARFSIDVITLHCGVDHGMIINFHQLAMSILAAVGIPAICILVPCHFFLGGVMDADSGYSLSRLSMDNVKHDSWLYWVHAFFVWYVVLVVRFFIWRYHYQFLPRRLHWWAELPPPRSTTVLIENVPRELRSVKRLREYFDTQIFDKPVVQAVIVVKDTEDLLAMMAERITVNRDIEKHEEKAKKRGINFIHVEEERLRLMQRKEDLADEIQQMRAYIVSTDAANMDSAFVTFDTRRHAAIAMKLTYMADLEEFVVSLPPEPEELIWADLKVDHERAQAVRDFISLVLCASLFFAFMPIIVGISTIASLQTLSEHIPAVDDLMTRSPALATTWNALVGTLALQFMMMMLPSLLSLIFRRLGVNKAQVHVQHRIQQYYFWLQVVFVLLVTAIGSSLWRTAKQLAQEPFEIFPMLARTMPQATNFYLSYMTLQWVTHAANFSRISILVKYLFFRFILRWSQEDARSFVDVEDTDYDGMGARSARNTLVLVCSLVYCMLTPLISVLALINFALCRIFYTYLFVYVETRKSDSGGDFWITQMHHLQFGAMLFCVLMTGVLLERASNWIPGGIAAGALIQTFATYYRFLNEFNVEFKHLPISAGNADAAQKRIPLPRGPHPYSQAELFDDPPEPPGGAASASSGGAGAGAVHETTAQSSDTAQKTS